MDVGRVVSLVLKLGGYEFLARARRQREDRLDAATDLLAHGRLAVFGSGEDLVDPRRPKHVVDVLELIDGREFGIGADVE